MTTDDGRPAGFGDFRVDAWVMLAVALDADVQLKRFGFAKEIRKQVGDWTIVLDRLYDPSGTELFTTRIRAEFLNPEGFTFRITSETPLTPVARLFRLLDDVESGDRAFDEGFVCQSDDAERLRDIIKEPEVRRLIRGAAKHPFRLEVVRGGLLARARGRDKDVSVLEFSELLPAQDLDALKDLFDLFAEVLDRICARGRAYADPVADAALPEGTPASLRTTYAAVARATVHFAGRPERQGDAIVHRLALERPVHATAELRVTAPELPRNRCEVVLVAELPEGSATTEPASGLLAGAQIEVTQQLEIRHPNVPPAQLDGVIAAALERWRRAVESAG